MTQATAGIVKKTMVRPAGSRSLGAPPRAAPTRAASRARIVELNDEAAIVEITCACGNRMLLRCEIATDEEGS